MTLDAHSAPVSIWFWFPPYFLMHYTLFLFWKARKCSMSETALQRRKFWKRPTAEGCQQLESCLPAMVPAFGVDALRCGRGSWTVWNWNWNCSHRVVESVHVFQVLIWLLFYCNKPPLWSQTGQLDSLLTLWKSHALYSVLQYHQPLVIRPDYRIGALAVCPEPWRYSNSLSAFQYQSVTFLVLPHTLRSWVPILN